MHATDQPAPGDTVSNVLSDIPIGASRVQSGPAYAMPRIA